MRIASFFEMVPLLVVSKTAKYCFSFSIYISQHENCDTSVAESRESIFLSKAKQSKKRSDSQCGHFRWFLSFSIRTNRGSFSHSVFSRNEKILFCTCGIDSGHFSSCRIDKGVHLFVIHCYWCSGLNLLTKENMDFVLDQNNTVLAIWNSANCMDCGNDMWDVYHTIYSFLDEPTVTVMRRVYL